mmetsp:Transcript_25723/g.60307  ORF Transcript_25723/g.60307 Transcript_25723/m.60307 type:complete len:537 (+) Transcript_25723:233-1843(+)
MVYRHHDHDYCNQDEDDATRWLMPHPLAYLYRVSLDVDFLKITMKEYCTKIYLVRKEHKLTSARLFSSASARHAKELIKRINILDEEEEELRAGFQLARCLWQLEHIMVKTNLALTKWRRSKNQLEELLDGCDDSEYCPCCGYQCGNFTTDSLSCDELQKQLEQDEEDCAAIYEECGNDQAKISKEIATHLGILTPPSLESSSFPQFPKCDDFMVEYVLKNYCKCSGCIFFYNKKDLGLFGQIQTTSATPDNLSRWNDSCKSCNGTASDDFRGMNPALMAENFLEAGKSGSDERGKICFRSFYCLECYEIMQEKRERQKAAAAVFKGKETAITSSSSVGKAEIKKSETNCTTKINSPAKTTSIIKETVKDDKGNEDGESNSTIDKRIKTNAKKKRRRKKKKKKVTVTQTPASPSSTSETDWKKVATYFSASGTPESMALDEEEKRDEATEEMASSHNQSNILVRESCANGTTTITTTISSAATNQLLESVTDAIQAVTIESVEDNRNDLWVDYLWKTGSMIALDRYMDEMEGILGD